MGFFFVDRIPQAPLEVLWNEGFSRCDMRLMWAINVGIIGCRMASHDDCDIYTINNSSFPPYRLEDAIRVITHGTFCLTMGRALHSTASERAMRNHDYHGQWTITTELSKPRHELLRREAGGRGINPRSIQDLSMV
jgi:hypothetical protein